MLDFTKNQLTYNNKDVFRHVANSQIGGVQQERVLGPTFRHIQKNLIGPAFPGEYVAPEEGDGTGQGLYIMSYPGVAFSFPVKASSWDPKQDVVSLLSSSGSSPAVAMAIFPGDLWPVARERLFTQTLNPREVFAANTKGREPVPDEVCLVKIHGEGRLELLRPDGSPSHWIQLGLTSPQDLVATLGPPDAIYRKSDQRMSIHKARPSSANHSRSDSDSRTRDDTDTDASSAHTATDDSEDGEEGGEVAGSVSGECFYNYFYHGFDVLVSPPTQPSQTPPSKKRGNPSKDSTLIPGEMSSRVVATKFILHGNVPGSYPFNRHRRCRWEIIYLPQAKGQGIVHSETPFKDVEHRLHEEWKSIYKDDEEAKYRQRGMVLARDWGDSPGSSVELLGGWEESVGGKRTDSTDIDDVKGLGNTTLFGFPGLVFEVLSNGTVSGLTVF